MSNRTIQGTTCPQCSSFVRSGLSQCAVCGCDLDTGKPAIPQVDSQAEYTPEPTTPPGEEKTLTCTRCGSENDPDARFCKICKHPFTRFGGSGESQLSAIQLVWSMQPQNRVMQDRLDLVPIPETNSSYAIVWGYMILALPEAGQTRLVVTRIHEETVRLFRAFQAPFMLSSGKTFYAGAIQFRITGSNTPEDSGSETVIRPEATILKGPGEKLPPRTPEGPAELHMLDLDPGRRTCLMQGNQVIGRSALSEMFEIENEKLKTLGISDPHFKLSLIGETSWLFEPENQKKIYVEIGAEPVILDQGDQLRWLDDNQVGEFSISPLTGG